MVDRHPLYLGWFVHDGAWAEQVSLPDTRLVLPAIRRVLTNDDFDSLDPEHAELLLGRMSERGYVCVELTDASNINLRAVREFVTNSSCDVLDKNLRVTSLSEQIGDDGG